MDHRGRQVQSVHKVSMALKVFPVLLVRKDIMDHRDHQVLPDLKVLMGRKALLVLLVRKDIMDRRDRRATTDRRVLQVRLVHKALMALRVHPVVVDLQTSANVCINLKQRLVHLMSMHSLLLRSKKTS